MEKILFENFVLSDEVKRAVAEVGYVEPTPIQAQSIPYILEGRDVIGRSHTGTGKTAAFGLPAIERIDPDLDAVQVLVLCPTRELAMQAAEEVGKFAKYKRGVKVVSVYGGASIERQIQQLKRGANFVIGTPGRVMDHMRRRTLKLDRVRMMILDEADEMLNMGFREDIETILEKVPQQRQTILFSATMPKPIMEITRQYQTDPVLVAIGEEGSQTAAKIEQFYYDCPMGRKMDVLNLLLHYHEPQLSIVFCNTKKMVDELSDYLNANGFKAVGIHGDMKQAARTQVMNAFKSHRSRILIATDVAARGIDVENVNAVFNFDIPQDNEYYVHRIGRTARAGREGRAYTLISGRKQFYQLRDIMSATGAKVVRQEIPAAEEIYARQRTAFVDALAERILQPGEDAAALFEELAQRGFTAEQVAQGALSMLWARKKLNLPQVAAVSRSGREKSGEKFSGIVLSIGRRQRIAPNFILGAIADATGLPGKSVGKIDIYDDYTVVQMSDEHADTAVQYMSTCRINGHKTEVRLIEKNERFAPRDSGRGGKPFGKGRGRFADSRSRGEHRDRDRSRSKKGSWGKDRDDGHHRRKRG